MSSTLTEPGSATRPGQGRRPPARLHHNNFYTSDLEATRHFYEDVAGLPLKVFYIDHGVLRSLYVRDPNGLLVEFAVDPDGHQEMYRMEAERAHEMMRRFLAGDRTPTIPEKL